MPKQNNLDSLREAERAGVFGPSIAHIIGRYILEALCVLAIGVIAILTMIHGWGLEPKSWPWIISGAALSYTAMLISKIVKSPEST